MVKIFSKLQSKTIAAVNGGKFERVRHVYGWESSADISYFELSKNITRLRTTGGKFI